MQPRSDTMKMKNSTQTTLPHFNFSITAELNDVRSRIIILINEEINKANCMISNSAKLDRRTKQHTDFGVSASHGSRDMVRTKSWRKKKEKKNERFQNHIASPMGIANYLRNTMGQDRLSSLTLLSTEHETLRELDYTDVIKQFASDYYYY